MSDSIMFWLKVAACWSLLSVVFGLGLAAFMVKGKGPKPDRRIVPQEAM